MPSTRQLFITLIMPLLALALPTALAGQQLSGQVSVPIRVTVRPVVAIHGVAASSTASRGAIVSVESNLPYRLSVRLAPSAAASARVLVRDARGAYEPLDVNGSVTAVISTVPGRRHHDIACRVESPAPEPCALVYELSAEYHDSLIRSTATLPLPLPLSVQ